MHVSLFRRSAGVRRAMPGLGDGGPIARMLQGSRNGSNVAPFDRRGVYGVGYGSPLWHMGASALCWAGGANDAPRERAASSNVGNGEPLRLSPAAVATRARRTCDNLHGGSASNHRHDDGPFFVPKFPC